MVTVKKFTYADSDLMQMSNEIRRIVFIEEQQVDPEIEYEYEEEGHYYLLFEAGKPVATARWRTTSRGVSVGVVMFAAVGLVGQVGR